MILQIQDETFRTVDLVEEFASLIWAERYYAPGDFEIYLPYFEGFMTKYPKDKFLYNPVTNTHMVIEDYGIKADPEDQPYLTITGRTLDSYFDRRIAWGTSEYSGKIHMAIYGLLYENALSPTITAREIPNLIYQTPTLSTITAPEMSETQQYHGKNILECIQELCMEGDFGYRVKVNDNKQMVFSLYKGLDRSSSQSDNIRVIFSPEYENLKSSEWLYTERDVKTTAQVKGKDGDTDIYVSVEFNTVPPTGLSRREVLLDGSSVPHDLFLYEDFLTKYGRDQLRSMQNTEGFSGEVLHNGLYTYGTDYNLGDIIQIENTFSRQAEARIVEVLFTHDGEGEKTIPTLVKV